MDPLITFMLFTAAVTGAVFYRMRGGAPSWPRPLEQILFCTVFGVVMAALAVAWGWQLAAFALAVVSCLTGHGQFFLEQTVKPIEPERLDFLLRPVFGRDPRTDERFQQYWDDDGDGDTQWLEGYADAVDQISALIKDYGPAKLYWRSVAGMALTGGAVSLAPGLALMLAGHVPAGLAVAASGFISKGTAYAISHKLGQGTEGGEYGHGALQWFLVVLAAVLALGLL